MLKMILATGLNGELGQNNQLLMHIPEDLKHFKKVTDGKVVVMGRKTAESLPNGKPLPNRVNIVMTRQPYENGCEGFLRCNDYKKVLKIAETEDVFIIGGAEIYKLFEDYVEEVYWTLIHKFFPEADTHYTDSFKPWNFEVDHSDTNYKKVISSVSGVHIDIERWTKKKGNDNV